MTAGLAQETEADGTVLRSPIVGAMLRCEGCGDLLRFLTRWHGRALCRECVGLEVTGGRRR